MTNKNYYRRLFRTCYQLLRVRAVNLGWLLLVAIIITLHILMLNAGLVPVKIALILAFLVGLMFEISLILTTLTASKEILNQTDLLLLTSWQQFVKKRWKWLSLFALLLAIVWLPFGDVGFTSPVLNLMMLPLKWIDVLVLQRRIVVAFLGIAYIGIVLLFLAVLARLCQKQTTSIRQRLVWFIEPLIRFWLPLYLINHLFVLVLRFFSERLTNGLSNGVSLIVMIGLICLSLVVLSALLIAMFWQSLGEPEFQPRFDETDDQLHSMAWFPTGLVFLLVALFGFQAFHISSAAAPSITIAHRGMVDSHGIPNSVATLKRSSGYRPNFVETDVQETKDGQFIVAHGEIVRWHGKATSVQKLTLKQLTEKPLKVNQQTVRLVSLQTYLTVAHSANQRVIVELKVTPRDSKDVASHFAKLYGTQLIAKHDFVHTMSYRALLNIKRAKPNLITGYVVPLNLMSIKNVPADFYSLQAIGLNTTMVRQAHSVGAPVFAWTPDRKTQMQRMRVLGVDGQITDRLSLLQAVNHQSLKEFNWAIVDNVVNQFC